MKLSWDQYERGIVFWDTQPGVFEFAIESVTDGGLSVVSAPLTDPRGSLVSSLVSDKARFIIRLNAQHGSASKFRWERAAGTSVWDGLPTGERLALLHIPDYGTYHRLVLNAGNCDWGGDAVVMFGNVRIRFVTGSVEGERAAPMDEVTVEEGGKFSITGEASGSATASGRFVDISAPGEDERAALENAWSAVGLVGLILGPAAVASVVFSEGYSAEPKRFGGSLEIPITAQSPYVADEDAADLIDLTLPALAEDSRHARALRLALRWYAKAMRSSEDEDQLFSHFIGIETLLNAYTSDHGPVPEERERRKMIASRQVQLKKLLGDRFDAGRMAAATLFEKFRFYATQRDLPGSACTSSAIWQGREMMLSTETRPGSASTKSEPLRNCSSKC